MSDFGLLYFCHLHSHQLKLVRVMMSNFGKETERRMQNFVCIVTPLQAVCTLTSLPFCFLSTSPILLGHLNVHIHCTLQERRIVCRVLLGVIKSSCLPSCEGGLGDKQRTVLCRRFGMGGSFIVLFTQSTERRRREGHQRQRSLVKLLCGGAGEGS